MITMTVNEAADEFGRVLTLVRQGEEVVLLDHDQPVARVTCCEPSKSSRPRVGVITSAPVRCTEDCFAPFSDGELTAWGL